MKMWLLKRWCQAPWHAWLKEEKQWLDIFSDLWAKLPDGAVKKILHDQRTLIILPPVAVSRAVRITQPLPSGANLIQLQNCLLDRPREETLAILAHELAHLCIPASADEAANELEADRLASSWGFNDGLLKALQRDFDETHPRVVNQSQFSKSA